MTKPVFLCHYWILGKPNILNVLQNQYMFTTSPNIFQRSKNRWKVLIFIISIQIHITNFKSLSKRKAEKSPEEKGNNLCKRRSNLIKARLSVWRQEKCILYLIKLISKRTAHKSPENPAKSLSAKFWPPPPTPEACDAREVWAVLRWTYNPSPVLYDHRNFKYCTLYVSGTELLTNRLKDRWWPQADLGS